MNPTTPRLPAVLTVSALLLALAACTTPSAGEGPSDSSTPSSPSDSPTPEPTRPALADLVLTADGLGTLELGAAPNTDPSLSMVSYDPIACTDAVTGQPLGIVEGSPNAGLWTADPSFTVDSHYGPGAAFAVDIAADVVRRIDLYSDHIATDTGIRFGSTRADVAAAYPGVTPFASYLTDVFVIPGRSGNLMIEVARDAEYWTDQNDKVQYLRADAIDVAPYSVAASENVLGVCQY